ncbi:hypothetical protein Tco_0123828 [Tanacetum coccineum]
MSTDMNQNFYNSNSFGFDQIQPPQQFDNHQPQEIPEVIPFIESKEWIEIKNELYKMMEAYTERMNQQREQEALLAAQREQELLAQKQAAQEKEEPPQNSDFHTLIDSSPKFDYLLEEFSGELAHINPIPPGIEEADFDLEEEISSLVTGIVVIDNSSTRRPPEELNAGNC